MTSKRCDRRNCCYYHVAGTSRPFTDISVPVHRQLNSKPTPLMQIDVPYLQNPISTFLYHKFLYLRFQYPRFQLIFYHQMSHHIFFRTAEGTKIANDPITTNALLSGSKSNRSYMAPINKDSTSTCPHLHDTVNDRSITLVPSMYSFILMNVARLITLTKRKNEIIPDFCDKSTLFLCLCENFYMKEYLTVRLKSPASLLLDVTVHLELVVECVCMYLIQLLMTPVWHTQTLSVSYLYTDSINLPSLLFLCIVPQPAHPKISMIL